VSWVIWITGPPGSGKSAITRAAARALADAGVPVRILELDAMRKVVTPSPTYSDAERTVVYRALVWVAAALVDAGANLLIDATGHRREWRDLARTTIADFAEVQLRCSLETCRAREARRHEGSAPRGIYARAGQTVPEWRRELVDGVGGEHRVGVEARRCRIAVDGAAAQAQALPAKARLSERPGALVDADELGIAAGGHRPRRSAQPRAAAELEDAAGRRHVRAERRNHLPDGEEM